MNKVQLVQDRYHGTESIYVNDVLLGTRGRNDPGILRYPVEFFDKLSKALGVPFTVDSMSHGEWFKSRYSTKKEEQQSGI